MTTARQTVRHFKKDDPVPPDVQRVEPSHAATITFGVDVEVITNKHGCFVLPMEPMRYEDSLIKIEGAVGVSCTVYGFPRSFREPRSRQ